ncbi:MAG: TIGR01906 family membrane protein [Clostridiales bacterium]|nr:TIGR01906 family membrane protein [Clostridiales bacterium]
MRKFFFIVYFLIGAFLSLAVLLAVVDRVAFNTRYYLDFFIQNDIPEITGMDIENLEIAVKDLIEYMRDDSRALLDTVAIVHGRERAVFGERAVLHMVDVKNLFVLSRQVRNLSVLAVLTLLFIAYRIDNKEKFRKNVSKTLYFITAVNFLLICIVGAMIYFDFNRYFTYFHYIFFTNDLWLLDPRHEVLIQMLPLNFFISITIRIVVYYMSILVLLSLGNRIFTVKAKNHNSKVE